GRPRRKDPVDSGRAGDRGPARARAAEALAALSVDLRDGDRGLVRVDREGAAPARLATALLEQGRARPQLPLVRGQRGPARRGRRHPPGALETGRAGAGQARVSSPRVIDGAPWRLNVRFRLSSPTP